MLPSMLAQGRWRVARSPRSRRRRPCSTVFHINSSCGTCGACGACGAWAAHRAAAGRSGRHASHETPARRSCETCETCDACGAGRARRAGGARRWPAPMLATKHRRVARGRHGNHGTHGRPIRRAPAIGRAAGPERWPSGTRSPGGAESLDGRRAGPPSYVEKGPRPRTVGDPGVRRRLTGRPAALHPVGASGRDRVVGCLLQLALHLARLEVPLRTLDRPAIRQDRQVVGG
jgi:hypothetical protein